MRLVFDIEANGLLHDATKIWCIYAKDIDTGEAYEWKRDGAPNSRNSIDKILDVLSKATCLIGHNIIAYDLKLLEKLTGWKPSEFVSIQDTLCMSYLANPDRKKPRGYTGKGGAHSLEAWGYRVGRGKPDHSDWSQFSEEMWIRCKEDVEINIMTYFFVREELTPESKWKNSLELEQAISSIISDQEIYGILFNREQALEYIAWLDKKVEEIDNILIPSLPKELKKIGTVPINEPFLKTGQYRKQTQDYLDEAYSNEQHSGLVGGPFNRICFHDFDLGSVGKVKDYLLEHGWIPEAYNYSKKTGERTSPKLEGNFEGIEGELPRLVKQRITWNHRKSQIQGWLSRIREDGRLSAGALSNATNTGRMKHINVVNVPKANSDKSTGLLIWDTDLQRDIFGTQMRSLFIVPEGYKMVGHDAKGLELRMLAHFMNDKEFIYQILNGDIHEYNQRAAGLPDRDSAKTFIYALIYGAGDEKLGSIVGGSSEDGAELRRKYFDSLPKLARLIDSVQKASEKGYINGLDGRALKMRNTSYGGVKRSAALNTLLQNAGSVVMKRSCLILWESVRNAHLDAHKVLDMHDEGQAEVLERDVEEYCELAGNSLVYSGEYYDLNIPIEADVKVGNNWAETH